MWIWSWFGPFFSRVFRRIRKVARTLLRLQVQRNAVTHNKPCAVRLWTRKSELQRLLEAEPASTELSLKISACLQQSNKLGGVKHELFDGVPFSVDHAVEGLMRVKGIRRQTDPHGVVIPRLTRTLEDLNGCNYAYSICVQYRNVVFSNADPNHVDLLAQLWGTLKPLVSLPGLVGPHWKTIGFQGVDPSTDFRGNGLLGLLNMLAFATRHQPLATTIIMDNTLPTDAALPFAITSINMTSFVIELIHRRTVERYFYDLATPVSPSDAMNRLNNVFAEIMALFPSFYASSNPRTIMDFPVVFRRFQHNLVASMRNGVLPNMVPQNV